MILSKTPFRISFAGGGSDYFNKKSELKGRVIVTTINKYIYVALNKRYDNNLRISYSQTENINNVKNIRHEIIRESLKYYKIKNGVEVVTIADIPSSGSGLASSSALTVGLSNALSKFKNLKISKEIMSKDACNIEIKKCKKPIGMQDQYSTAYGGLNKIEFYKNKVEVKKINLSNQKLETFNENLLLFYTGINRKAGDILKKIKKSGNQFVHYDKLSILAANFEKELILNNYDNCGSILHENWLIKRRLNQNVSSINLDQMYEEARNSGAIGGKILGAGGGGYFLFLAKPKFKKRIIKKLSKLQYIDFSFTKKGSEIIEA
jgi:D-glycero-alpha-D-manno-heptose-7-phosphate kinase